MIVLASASPRRRQLMKKVTERFLVEASGDAETSAERAPEKLVAELSRRKAAEVFAAHKGDVVIGADTVVALDGEIFGKPKDAAQAFDMLSRLSGRTHDVFTGVTILSGGAEESFSVHTRVTFRPLSEAEIRAYIDGGSPFDKAGAYGIQDCGFVTECDDVDNVMGLPTRQLRQALLRLQAI